MFFLQTSMSLHKVYTTLNEFIVLTIKLGLDSFVGNSNLAILYNTAIQWQGLVLVLISNTLYSIRKETSHHQNFSRKLFWSSEHLCFCSNLLQSKDAALSDACFTGRFRFGKPLLAAKFLIWILGQDLRNF